MGVVRLIFELIVVTGALIVIIANIPQNVLFDRFPLEPISFTVQDVDKAIAAFQWNEMLGEKARILLRDKVIGPESLIVTDSFIYTGLSDGRLIEIDKESLNFRTITRFEKDDKHECYDFSYWNLQNCGRPLGLRLDLATGDLLVLDSFSGLYKVNVKSGEKQLIALGENDNRPKNMRGLLNDIVVDPQDSNLIYVTASSAKWTLEKVMWSLIEHENTGFVLAVDLKSKKVAKIADKLYFANGIDHSADKKYLLVSETGTRRISKFNLDEIRKRLKSGETDFSVKSEVFADNLAGEVDNIRLHNGDLYIALALTRHSGPALTDKLAEYPMIRKAFGRILYLSSKIVKFVHDTLYKHPALQEVEFMMSSGNMLYSVIPYSGSIAILDGNSGKIKKTFGSIKFSFVSEAVLDEKTGDIYFGSFRNRFLGKLAATDMK
ncbi:adipocyte plasma membrane-associated protein-like protein [Dinothrombium tinctorium]|uniref:Adipocyte plasma membrane-associated protein-like protein n=1 Tax=Dinothrombium tinctorium TaxID=1965070 RepID=A0A3S3Q349_9ACAR|nr:adipocyte plasma membrane-associated protein-like protein [Dinothrombium tinctorium]RWS13064.1 adipocyte plasma membrane-associated protein-like protein [Dinothrombium tinctorium]